MEDIKLDFETPELGLYRFAENNQSGTSVVENDPWGTPDYK